MLQGCPVSTWSHGGFPCVCFLLPVCSSCYCVCFLSLLCFLLHTSVCFLLLCVLFAACVLGADEPLFQPEMLTAVVSPLELCPKLVLCVVMGVVYCFNWPLLCGCVQIVGLLESGEWCIAHYTEYFSCVGLVNLGLTLQRLECLYVSVLLYMIREFLDLDGGLLDIACWIGSLVPCFHYHH